MFGTSYLSPGGVRAAFDHSFGSSLPIWLLDVVELLLGFCPLPDPVEGRTLGLPVEFPPLSSVNDWAVSEDSRQRAGRFDNHRAVDADRRFVGGLAPLT